jgi:beta-1,4-mannosyl-glycoprotein beta-1,4-N-acetylglucosaminyltransferase
MKLKRKIVDCFTFYNEYNMLKFRLTELYDTVDHFVIVEADKTHAGADKEMNFLKVEEDIKQFLDKVIYIQVTDMPVGDDAWVRERHQRNCISRGLDVLDLQGDDIVTITDCDEIPDPGSLKGIADYAILQPITLLQDMYYYNLNTRLKSKWHHPKLATYELLKTYRGAENIRMSYTTQAIENGGWHFSYFGDIKMIQNKLMHFAHQEFNTDEFTSEENIKEAIANHRDLFKRDGIDYEFVDIKDNSYLPKNYKMLL